MKSFKKFINEVKKPTGDLKKACWTGYTAVGMKMKGGRKVPNCVPEEVEQLDEYGDTAKGQKMLTKVQKRAVDRVTSKKADTDPKYAKKNSDTANRAWDRMTDKDVAEGFNADAYDEEHYYRGHTKDKNGEFQPGPKFDSLGAAQKWRKETPGEHKVTLHRRQQDVTEGYKKPELVVTRYCADERCSSQELLT